MNYNITNTQISINVDVNTNLILSNQIIPRTININMHMTFYNDFEKAFICM